MQIIIIVKKLEKKLIDILNDLTVFDPLMLSSIFYHRIVLLQTMQTT